MLIAAGVAPDTEDNEGHTALEVLIAGSTFTPDPSPNEIVSLGLSMIENGGYLPFRLHDERDVGRFFLKHRQLIKALIEQSGEGNNRNISRRVK